MKIGIFCGNLLPFHFQSLEEKPLGGTETGVIHLANELQLLGHDVTVFTREENPPPSSPRYRNLKDLDSQDETFDLFLSIRDWMPVFYSVRTRMRMMWTGDSYDVGSSFGIGDLRVSKKMDRLLAVSRWQAESLARASGFPPEKIWVIGNGVDLRLFEGSEKRNPKRLIYSSTPHRGLTYVPGLFSELKKRHPDLECHIFSSYKVYGVDGLADLENFKSEAEKIPGIYFHGSVLQRELAREFMKSAILFYPCNFEETFCITAMEAQAAGCTIVTTKLAALPETVSKAGILIEGVPGTPAYDAAFVRAADEILTSERLFQQLSQFGMQNAVQHSWNAVAKRFDKFLREFDEQNLSQHSESS
jgi:glycosyltransferase involved in cell wall biosynthesis